MTGAAVQNWARNVTFQASRLHRPATLAELQSIVGRSKRVRALGTGHSFNRIADTTGDLVSVAGLPPTVDLDTARRQVRVAAGLRYGELTGQLHAAGLALPNLGSLPHISIAGASATGTHGSGESLGVLATAVTELELVTPSGDIVALGRAADPGVFPGAVVALGALGIVTSMTLELVPAYEMAQYVYEDLPRSELETDLDAILATAYSISLFTDWQSRRINQMWLKRRLDSTDGWTAEPQWRGAILADGPRHPLPRMNALNCTQQLGVPGPWHERLPGFRLEFTPSNGEELQSEFLLPREHALSAMAALDEVGPRMAPVLQASEIRVVARDDLWLSPAYGRDSIAFHFTWTDDAAAVAPVLAEVEAALAPFSPRPHWGKLFGASPADVAEVYERLTDFAGLARGFDPAGKLRNELLDRYVFAAAP